jgi:hypothetical protein
MQRLYPVRNKKGLRNFDLGGGLREKRTRKKISELIEPTRREEQYTNELTKGQPQPGWKALCIRMRLLK